jgi:hypothetical protein
VLQDDPTFHGHALNAMGYFAHLAKDDQLATSVERLRSHWAQLRETKAIRGYSVQFADAKTGTRSEMLSDSVLAYAWIYGDTVHADSAHRARTAALGVEERYRAAVPLVCQIMICTINTLDVIRAAAGRGTIELPDMALTDSVVATGKPELAEMRLFQADIDPNTPSPERDEALGYQWPEFRPPATPAS